LIALALGVRWHVERVSQSFAPVTADVRLYQLTEQARQQQEAVVLRPRDAALRWQLADTYQKLGALESAQKELRVIAGLQPTSATAPIALANTYLAFKDWRSAEKIYRQVVKQFPQRAEGVAGLAVALYHQEKYAEAIEPARRSVHANPNQPNYRFTLANCYLGLAASYPTPGLHADHLEDAIAHFTQTLRAWPDNGDVHLRIARCHIELGQTREALRWLRRSVELLPERADAAIMLAQRYKRSGNLEAARPLAKKLVAAHPDNAGLQSLWGELLMSSTAPNALTEMLRACRKATQLEPDNAKYWQQLGTACLQTNHDAEAETAFRRAIQSDPNDAFPYQQMASLATRHGKTKDAAQWASLAAKLQWNQQQLKQIELLSQRQPARVPLRLILAQRYQALGLLPAARSEYVMVLRLQPDNARARVGLMALERLKAPQ
jgi:superkiller protein 3